jgi:hypothetical protein
MWFSARRDLVRVGGIWTLFPERSQRVPHRFGVLSAMQETNSSLDEFIRPQQHHRRDRQPERQQSMGSDLIVSPPPTILGFAITHPRSGSIWRPSLNRFVKFAMQVTNVSSTI